MFISYNKFNELNGFLSMSRKPKVVEKQLEEEKEKRTKVEEKSQSKAGQQDTKGGSQPSVSSSPTSGSDKVFISPQLISEKESLIPTPNVDRLKQLVTSKLATTLDQSSENELAELIKYFSALEKDKVVETQTKQKEQELIQRLEQTKFWQSAKESVDEFKVSASYMVEIDFDKDKKLKEGANFYIRHSGTQDRHVTPVVVIEKIISDVLQPGKSMDNIIKDLLYKVKILGSDHIDNDFSQFLFDYYKNPEKINSGELVHLIKIVAHLYNQNLSLAMSDGHIQIPYNTNDCYIVPTLEFGGKLYTHAKEGSYISAMHKILDGFNQKAKANELNDSEQKQMVYAIFAMFDYLPLPKSPSIKSDGLDKSKHRYPSEDKERLYRVAANHLQFIFEAYPELYNKYNKDITKGFLQYVSSGVKLEDLYAITDCTNLPDLAKKLKMTTKDVRSTFTNDESGVVKGFAQQYKMDTGNFYFAMEKKVQGLLERKDHSFLSSPEFEQNVEKLSQEKEDKSFTLKSRIETHISTILFSWIEDKKNSQKDFGKLPQNYSAALNMDAKEFDAIYKQKIAEYIFQNKETFSKETQSFLKGLNKDKFIKEFSKNMEHLKSNESETDYKRIVAGRIDDSITAYYEKNPIKLEFSKAEELRKFYGVLKESQKSSSDIQESFTSDESFSLGQSSFEGSQSETPQKIIQRFQKEIDLQSSPQSITTSTPSKDQKAGRQGFISISSPTSPIGPSSQSRQISKISSTSNIGDDLSDRRKKFEEPKEPLQSSKQEKGGKWEDKKFTGRASRSQQPQSGLSTDVPSKKEDKKVTPIIVKKEEPESNQDKKSTQSSGVPSTSYRRNY